MSSGSPSQIVHEVGGPPRCEPEQPPRRLAGELAAQVVERRVEGRLRGWLARELREPALDRLERERVVAEQLRRLVEERLGTPDALAVVLLGLGLAEAARAVVSDLDPEDVLPTPSRGRS